jgi:prepilin-type N-terminal cleavage/methylation domain-containing protein
MKAMTRVTGMNKQRGFTLIEIAIVLVIIGLLLGGVLKGQELITSARVRNLITQQDGIKAAYFGFQDRYRALPGDYAQATNNINLTTVNGNGNGQIESTAAVVAGSVPTEDIAVWEHLSRSGFITGTYAHGPAYAAASAPTNPYNMFLVMRFDNGYSDTVPAANVANRHNLKTGNQVPSDILAEVDRKVDDGNPLTGTFRFTAVSATGTAPNPATCINNGPPVVWNVLGAVEPNCGATTLF